MTITSAWTGVIDMNLWANLMDSVGDQLGDELWCSAIRVIAKHVLRQNGTLTGEHDEDESAIEELVTIWLNQSLPGAAHLSLIIGELDYFTTDYGLAWDERIGLTNSPCPSPDDILWDLQMRYENQSDEITYNRLISFYAEWRSEFLDRVCREARELVNTKPG